jgi:hypothetical protein
MQQQKTSSTCRLDIGCTVMSRALTRVTKKPPINAAACEKQRGL